MGVSLYVYTRFNDDAPKRHRWYPNADKALVAAEHLEKELASYEWIGLVENGIFIGTPQELLFEKEFAAEVEAERKAAL